MMSNVIRIDDVKTAEIEIEIGTSGVVLTYEYTDDKMLEEGKGRKELLKRMQNIDTTEEDDQKIIKEMQSTMHEAFDLLFGKGTYDTLFDIYKSSMVLANVFFSVNEAIDAEMKNRNADISAAAKSKKYLKEKKEKAK